MTAGRPTLFKPEFVDQARKLCRIGATDAEVADFFDICTSTYYRWRNEHPEFDAAVTAGKDHCDAQVQRALHQRAVGYEHQAVRIFLPAGAEKPLLVPYTVHVMPDVRAAQHWLRFRRPDEWSDRRKPEEKDGDLAAEIDEAWARVLAGRERDAEKTPLHSSHLPQPHPPC
jgi:transposase-like protein